MAFAVVRCDGYPSCKPRGHDGHELDVPLRHPARMVEKFLLNLRAAARLAILLRGRRWD